MQNESRIRKQKAIIIIMNVITTLLVLVLLWSIYVTIFIYSLEFSDSYNESLFSYNIECRDFRGLVQKYHTSIAEGNEGDEQLQEYYGVAKYYEAASLYNAYKVAGDEKKAEKYLEKMQQAEEQMGEWVILKETIHKELRLE